MKVKQQKPVIQDDANDFYVWAKNGRLVINYCFLLSSTYEDNKSFLNSVCSEVKATVKSE